MGNSLTSYYDYYFPVKTSEQVNAKVTNNNGDKLVDVDKSLTHNMIKLYDEFWTNKEKFEAHYDTFSELKHKQSKYKPYAYFKILEDFETTLLEKELTKVGNYIVLYSNDDTVNLKIDLLTAEEFAEQIVERFYTYDNDMIIKYSSAKKVINEYELSKNGYYNVKTLLDRIIYENNMNFDERMFSKLVKLNNPSSDMSIAFMCRYNNENDIYYGCNNDDIDITIRNGDIILIYADKNNKISIINYYPSNDIEYTYDAIYSEIPIIVKNITYKFM